MKKRINKNFKMDMYDECAKEDEELRDKYEKVADGFYAAVQFLVGSISTIDIRVDTRERDQCAMSENANV